jgi:hypothetical protein
MPATSGAVIGAPKLILHLEGAALALSGALFFCATTARGCGLKYATAFGDTHLGYIGG